MTEENTNATNVYERSLLGLDFRWPVEDEFDIALRDVFARVSVWLSSAGSSVGEGVISAGMHMTIGMFGLGKPFEMPADAESAKEMEPAFVSEGDLGSDQNVGYSVHMETRVQRRFRTRQTGKLTTDVNEPPLISVDGSFSM